MGTFHNDNKQHFFDNRPQDIIEAEMKSFQDHMMNKRRVREIMDLVDDTSYNDDLGKYVRNLVNIWKEEDTNDWN